MFSELLSELVPGAEHPEDLEMLVGVAATSQEMQDRVLELVGQVGGDCTAGHEGAVGDLSCMSIFSACFGLLTSVQLAATTWSGQIWISC